MYSLKLDFLKKFQRSNKFNLIIYFIISIGLIIFLHQINDIDDSRARRILTKINNSFERIETFIQEGNYKYACRESTYADKLIMQNIKPLQEIEPNYSWTEISKLLKFIPKQLCI